jgi:hypothetical protein
VNDNNDDRLIAPKGTTPIPSRKRPSADPKDDGGISDSNGVINLLDDDNKEEEEEEEEIVFSLINIDDDIEFPFLSPPSPPPSPSPTERPKKRTDIKRTPSKLDPKSSNTKIARCSDDRSKAVILSQKDEAKSESTLKQSKLSFNRNGNVYMQINPRASLLQPNSDNDRNGNRSTKSNSNNNNNKKDNDNNNNNNNNNHSNNEGNTKTDTNSLDKPTPSPKPKKKDPRCCTCPIGSLCKDDCSCKQVGLLCSSCEDFECDCINAFHNKELMPPLPWNIATSPPSSSTAQSSKNKKKISKSSTATSKELSNITNNNNNNNNENKFRY